MDLRVLVVHPLMTFYGGAELVVVKLANYMTEEGIENAVLTLNTSQEIRRELVGSELISPRKSLRLPPGVPHVRTLPPASLVLIKHVRKNFRRFDVINVHNFPAELTAFSCPKRVIWMCNEPPQLHFASTSPVERLHGGIVTVADRLVVRRWVDRVCVADRFNADRFERVYGIKPVIIPYGIDHEFFSRGDGGKAREMFSLGEGEFILLQVGALTHLKNQLESIEVVRSLRNRIPGVKLVLAGHGGNRYEQLLRRRVGELGLEKQVIFTGHLPRKIVRDLYAACDIALFPVKPQGGWLSPFEALCAGKPVVVSTRMTAAEMIKGNGIGTVTDDLPGAVMDIRTDPRKYRKMAERGSTWVKENLSWDRFCEKMVEQFAQSR